MPPAHQDVGLSLAQVPGVYSHSFPNPNPAGTTFPRQTQPGFCSGDSVESWELFPKRSNMLHTFPSLDVQEKWLQRCHVLLVPPQPPPAPARGPSCSFGDKDTATTQRKGILTFTLDICCYSQRESMDGKRQEVNSGAAPFPARPENKFREFLKALETLHKNPFASKCEGENPKCGGENPNVEKKIQMWEEKTQIWRRHPKFGKRPQMWRRKLKCEGENPNVEEKTQIWGGKPSYGEENPNVEEQTQIWRRHPKFGKRLQMWR